ncbi:MAG: hypothetical protein WBF75_21325 [Pseudonocardiaceae bacterium]
MGRPTDWTPLAERDPVPGDPRQVDVEARHLSTVAQEIQRQVTRLRAIANDHSDLKGQYVEKLKSAAGDVAESLDKVVGRYQKVSSALTRWVPELEYAQAESLKALTEAQQAHSQQLRLGQPTMRDPNAPETDQQKQADHRGQNSLNQADHDLAAARTRLNNAINHGNTNAQDRAADIRHAIDDGVADSWWDDFKEFVDRYAWLIKDICTVLEVIATILAVIALFIPGLNVIVILAIAATALALIGRTMLAAAGDGSWMDVALDVFALATFGFGKLAGSLMKGTFAASEDVAKGLIQAERDSSMLGKAGNLAGRTADLVQNNPLTKAAVSFLDRAGFGRLGDGIAGLTEKASGLLEKVSAAALENVSPSLDKTLATVSEDIKPLQTALYGGEKENLMLARKMTAITARFPENSQISQLGSTFAKQLNLSRGIFGAGVAADQWDKWAGGFGWEGPRGPVADLHTPGTGFYARFKESWKTEGGLW